MKIVLIELVILMFAFCTNAQERNEKQVSSSANASVDRKGNPNVLFIAIDDMNDWTTLFDPDNPIKTPNIERLAKRGMFFTHAYCAVPACVPSRTAILSGKSPVTTGCYNNGDSQRVWGKESTTVSLSQYFRNNGYLAKGAGKIFGDHWSGKGNDPRGTQYSWDEFKGLVFTEGYHLNGYEKEDENPLSARAFDWGEIPSREEMGDEKMVEYVSKVLDQKREKPIFLAAGIFKPHLPFYAPPEIFKKYPMDEVVLPQMPDNDLNDVPEEGKKLAHKESFIYSNVIKHEAPDVRSLKRMVQCYQASADYADSVVGRILDKLEASGKAENTIIVLWADHGYHLGDKESCVKFTLWEKANHVPFIIVAPGITKPNSRCNCPVSLLDLYPTLIELANFPTKVDLDGVSLVPLLKDPHLKWERPAIMTMGKGNHAVRTERWRYIHYSDNTEELYDHNNDPWEWTNLTDDSQFGNIKSELKKYLPKEISSVKMDTQN